MTEKTLSNRICLPEEQVSLRWFAGEIGYLLAELNSMPAGDLAVLDNCRALFVQKRA